MQAFNLVVKVKKDDHACVINLSFYGIWSTTIKRDGEASVSSFHDALLPCEVISVATR